MKRRTTVMVMAAALLCAGAQAAQPALTSAEQARARALPHYATAGFEVEGGEVVYGALVIAAFDDGPARVEFRGAGDGNAVVSGSFELADPARGSLTGPAGENSAIVESRLRIDGDGLFALDIVGQDAQRGPQRLHAFGRVIGTCWTVRNDTVRRVADLTKRPDCMRLFGGL